TGSRRSARPSCSFDRVTPLHPVAFFTRPRRLSKSIRLSCRARPAAEERSAMRRSFVRVRRLLPVALLVFPCIAAAQQPSASAQPQVVTPAPAPAPPKVPVFNRANQKLPEWLRVRGEFREWFEGFQNLGFTEGRDDGYALSRFRFNVAVTPNKYLSFQANLQDARVGGKTVGPTTAPFRGPFDLRAAFADVGTAKAPVAARLGRQELAFGEQRLLGHLAWVNTGRTWDAARAILRAKTFQVDVFAASLVRSLPDGFDKSGNGNRLVGAYATTAKLLP